MSNVPWHLQHIRKLIYCASALVILAIAVVSAADAPDAGRAWIAARELYGLWALALLLAAMLPGPLSYVLPWIPFKAHLLLGRRALGISCFVLAVAHVASYLGPALLRDWTQLFAAGRMWTAGLIIGLSLFTGLGLLAFTSTDQAVRRLGAGRWKRWHKSVYVLLPAALLHATFVGTDFGLNKGPDVNAEIDAGCLAAMLSVAAAWLLLFVFRKRRIRWHPALLQKDS